MDHFKWCIHWDLLAFFCDPVCHVYLENCYRNKNCAQSLKKSHLFFYCLLLNEANIPFGLFMLAHISYYTNTMHLILLLALTVLLSHTLFFSGRCLRFSHWGGFSAGLWSVISYLSWKPICFCSPFFLLLCSSWRWILPGGAASWSDCFW